MWTCAKKTRGGDDVGWDQNIRRNAEFADLNRGSFFHAFFSLSEVLLRLPEENSKLLRPQATCVVGGFPSQYFVDIF